MFNATTWAEYHQEDDTFTLHAEFKVPRAEKVSPAVPWPFIRVKQMTSEYRVNRQGQLQSLAANIEGDTRPRRPG